ncbi:MAG TPA: hypothetical protein VNM48_04020 [Chloroflexota bacterium]|nr:hypothetical protein [Chloroflexota bacterium]
MPKYRITAPDGGTYEVNAPEGASESDVMAYAQANYKAAPKADFSNVAGAHSKDPEPSVMDQVKRQTGLGVRSILQGAASTVGIVADPIIAGANALGANQATMRQGAGMFADRLGLPKPAYASERIAGDITEAVTGGGGWIGLGRGLAARAPGTVQRVGEVLASRAGTQVASNVGGAGAGGMTRESGGGQRAQLTAALAGGLTPGAVNGLAAMSVRGALRGGEAGRQRMEQGIRDFKSVGADASVGQATGNRRTQAVESMLAGGPTSAPVMTRAAENQASQIGAGLRDRADTFFPNASAERAGRAIEKGVEVSSRNIGAMRKALYWQADQHIPDTTRLPLNSTQQALAKLTTPAVGAESTTAQMVNPKIAALAKAVGEDVLAAKATGSGGLPYASVKEIRSRIGEELSDFSLTTDKPTAEYKALYRALSQDMEDAARKQGPDAMQAVRRANNYFKASADRLTQLERVVDKNGGPERVYNAAMAGTQDGGTTLRSVMQSLPKEGQQALTGAVIKRMGLATNGNQDAAGEVFSAQTFLTNWNKVSPEAKRALFDRHGPGFAANMDKIARVSERIRTGSKVFANPSGSAKLGGALLYAGSLAGALLTGQVGAFTVGATGGAAAYGLASAMTNPKFVAWLARTTEMPVSALPQQALILKGVADRSGDDDLAAFAESLQQPHN